MNLNIHPFCKKYKSYEQLVNIINQQNNCNILEDALKMMNKHYNPNSHHEYKMLIIEIECNVRECHQNLAKLEVSFDN